ncbi:hypothetical protein [Metabacillus halosaccharovorans]|uniref:hypothetical protein n=1 Tax=Metabacillus halosaccharovorans TaxID=930124 RepID=UPI001C1F7034|nr:hypothetical protein [Metabacillus halosaccharovorans]MBU7594465.1 hypothetical protein [Metabacillus halosaccharovorans]
MKKYKKWYMKILSFTIISLLIIATINYVVDPYNIYKTPTFKGFNENKIETKEYLMKAREIAIYKPDTIFLGSSRTRVGLDPDYYKKITGETAYNAGLSSSNIYIQLKYLEYALQNNNSLKRVILGIDFEVFNINLNNSPYYDENRLKHSIFVKNDLLDTLFTINALGDTIKVIKDNLFNQSFYIQNNYYNNGSHNENIILANSKRSLLLGKNNFYDHLKGQINSNSISSNYQLSKERLDDLKKVIKLCKEHDIELIVFIHPIHAIQLEAFEIAGIWDEFEHWKKEVIKMTPLWDFSGFNTLTATSPYNFNYYIDQSHYRKRIGNLILDRVLGDSSSRNTSGDFGIFLKTENINGHLLEIRKNKVKWEEDNPEIVTKIKRLFIEK